MRSTGKKRESQRDVTAGVAGVETSSRPSGQAPAIIVGTYGNDIGQTTTSSGPAASSEMVLQMLDTLMTGHEPFYADYPSYQEAEPLTHPHHQHPHQHAIARNTGMPPVSLDATTHTPGTHLASSSLLPSFLPSLTTTRDSRAYRDKITPETTRYGISVRRPGYTLFSFYILFSPWYLSKRSNEDSSGLVRLGGKTTQDIAETRGSESSEGCIRSFGIRYGM